MKISKEKILNFLKLRKKCVAIISCCLIIIISISVIIFAISKHNEKVKKEQEQAIKSAKEYNDTIDCLWTIYNSAYLGASDAENICVTTHNTWKDAIFGSPSSDTKKYVNGASDFNEAVENVYKDNDIIEKLENVSQKGDEIDECIDSLKKSSTKIDDCFDAAIELKTSYNRLYDLASDPGGMNLKSYGDKESEMIDNFLSKADALKAIIPDKKEIPTYDNASKKLYKEFSFLDNYLQPFDAAPGTSENSSMKTKDGSVYGIDGRFLYVSLSSDLTSMITFSSTNKVSDDDFKTLTNNLEVYCDSEVKESSEDFYTLQYGDKVLKTLMITNDDHLIITIM